MVLVWNMNINMFCPQNTIFPCQHHETTNTPPPPLLYPVSRPHPHSLYPLVIPSVSYGWILTVDLPLYTHPLHTPSPPPSVLPPSPRNHIPEKKGTWMEEWHQKLHNNTTPDDVPICSAYIAFLEVCVCVWGGGGGKEGEGGHWVIQE